MRLKDCSSKNIAASSEDYQQVYESFLNDPTRIWIIKQMQSIVERSSPAYIVSAPNQVTLLPQDLQTDTALLMLEKELESIKKEYFELP